MTHGSFRHVFTVFRHAGAFSALDSNVEVFILPHHLTENNWDNIYS